MRQGAASVVALPLLLVALADTARGVPVQQLDAQFSALTGNLLTVNAITNIKEICHAMGSRDRS